MKKEMPKTLGVYDVVEIIKLEKDGKLHTKKLRLRCRECGAEKIIKIGNRRHFENTRFCRSCPPEVRSRIYGETWSKKDTKKERSLTEEEVDTRKEWHDVFNKIGHSTRQTR